MIGGWEEGNGGSKDDELKGLAWRRGVFQNAVGIGGGVNPSSARAREKKGERGKRKKGGAVLETPQFGNYVSMYTPHDRTGSDRIKWIIILLVLELV